MTVLSLAEYEEAVGGVLAFSLDELGWPNEVVDAGLRMALGEYERAAPTVQVEFEVIAAGMKQDLSTIEDLRKVGAVAWPWVAPEATSFTGRPRWVRFMTFDGSTVRLLDCAPAIGDYLLVRYWRKFGIAGLGYVTLPGGIEGPPLDDSNVPEAHQALLIQGAAGLCVHGAAAAAERAGGGAGGCGGGAGWGAGRAAGGLCGGSGGAGAVGRAWRGCGVREEPRLAGCRGDRTWRCGLRRWRRRSCRSWMWAASCRR